MTKKIKLCVVILFYGLTAGYAQQAVTSSGNNALGTGAGSVSYSVGQIACSTFTGLSGSVVEGVQQTYIISSVMTAKNVAGISYTVFPNPADDYLLLNIPDYKNEKYSYQLFDLQGKLLKSDRLTNISTRINTSMLAPSVYFLHIIQQNERIKTFKIIKQ